MIRRCRGDWPTPACGCSTSSSLGSAPTKSPTTISRRPRGRRGDRGPPRHRPDARSRPQPGHRPVRPPLRPRRRPRSDGRARVPLVDGTGTSAAPPRRRSGRSAQRRHPRRRPALLPVGFAADQLASLPAGWFRCVQLCDAPPPCHRPATTSSAWPGRRVRFPGTAISLGDLLAHLPLVPYSLEVPNDVFRQELGTADYARFVLATARVVIAGPASRRAVIARRPEGTMTAHPLAAQRPDATTTAPRRSVRLGLIGRGIDNSLAAGLPYASPASWSGSTSPTSCCPARPAAAARIDELLRRTRRGRYDGVNVTVPFKSTAWRSASDRPRRSSATGVANTLLLRPAGPTDGVQHRLHRLQVGLPPAIRRHAPGTVALLGAGGVGSATAAALVDLGATAVQFFDIRAGAVGSAGDEAARSSRSGRGRSVAASAEAAVDGVDGVVNGTPVGMYLHPGSARRSAAIGGQRGSSMPSTRRSRPR